MGDFRLKVFASVAKNLSFTKASQELFISQPSVTKHIQELEAAYQTRLFERKGNSIILTEAGRVFWEYSKRILEGYSRLEYEMSLLRNVHSGELRLGASTTIAQYVLPPLLAHFAERFPQITLNLLSGNSAQIEKALTEHRIDLGLVEGNARQQNLKYTAFMGDELVAVVNTHSRWRKCDEIEPSELCQFPLCCANAVRVHSMCCCQHSANITSNFLTFQSECTWGVPKVLNSLSKTATVWAFCLFALSTAKFFRANLRWSTLTDCL